MRNTQHITVELTVELDAGGVYWPAHVARDAHRLASACGELVSAQHHVETALRHALDLPGIKMTGLFAGQLVYPPARHLSEVEA